MIKKTVIVTALFDIGRDKWSNYNQSYNTYLYWMNNLLSIDSDFIIFTEKKFVEHIKQKRIEIDSELLRTHIVITDFENLESYKKYFGEIKKLMDSEDFKKKIHFQVPEMVYPEYNTIIFNKLNFIKKSIKTFDYDLYIWCDAGLLRDNKQKNLKFPNLKKINEGFNNKITLFSHDLDFKTNNRELHLLSQYRYIHGGCFFVPKDVNIQFFIENFEKKIDYFLEKGFVGSEEKYYDFCYEDNKNEFNLVKSDWRQYFEIFK